MKIRMLAATAILALGFSAAQAQTQKLKFASFEPPQSISSVMWKQWVEQVNKDGAGALEIEMFMGGALGRDPRTQIELLLNGVADIAWTLPFFTPGRFPDNTVSNLPLIITNAREGSYAVWTMYEKGLLRGYEDLVPMGIFASPATVLFSTKPMPTLASLANQKASAATDLQQKILRALGAAPVSGFNFNTTAEALSRGTIDMDLMNFTASVSFKQFDVAKHAMIIPIGPSITMVAMNKDSYAKLSPKAKAAIDKNRGMPMVKLWADTITAREEEVRAKWRADSARTYNVPSAAEMASVEALLAPIVKEWENANPNGPALVKTLREEVAKARAAR